MVQYAPYLVNNMSKKTKRIVVGVTLLAFVVLIFGYALTSTRANSTPEQVTQRFYDAWIESADPVAQGLHRKSTYVTKDFGIMVDRAANRDEDAVLCGTPTSMLVLDEPRVHADDTQASIRVSSDTAEFYVILIRDERGWWRLDEVDCREPTILDLEEAVDAATERYGDEILQG